MTTDLKLFKYQLDAVKFCLNKDRVLLGHDTGLGKSAICVATVEELQNDTPRDIRILIVCPAFLRENWRREVEKWFCPVDLLDIQIVSYTYCSNDTKFKELMRRAPYDVVICDEAHYLRNWHSATTLVKRTNNIIRKLTPQTKKLILSTATPVVKSASDLHPLFSALEPGRWGKYKPFCEEFCLKKFDQWSARGFKYTGINKDNAFKLRAAMKRFGLRVKKTEVLTELPSKLTTDLYVDLPKDVRFTGDRERLAQAVKENSSGSFAEERHELGMKKAPIVADFVKNVGDKVVVFAWHRKVIWEITRLLTDSEYRVGFVLGGVAMDERNRIIDQFEDGECDILVGSMGVLGEGLNLTSAAVSVFAEIPWTYKDLKQCGDRLHRLGQTRTVNEYRIIGKDSIDDVAIEAVHSTIEVSEHTVGHFE